MTLEQIRASDKLWLLPDEVAEVLECNPQSIREQAHDDPSKLGFPTIVVGTRTRIPRIPFLHYFGG